MNCTELLQAATRAPLAGWECVPADGFLRLYAPMRYPDGDTIEVFAEVRGQTLVVTDFGEAGRFLATHGIDASRGAARKRAIDHAIRLAGATYTEGEIELYLDDPAQVIEAATRLSQALTRIADLTLSTKAHGGLTFDDQLEEFLLASLVGFEVERNKSVEGFATSHDVDIVVYGPTGINALEAMSAPTASGAQAQMAYAVAKFADFSKLGEASPRLYSVIDDSANVWTPPLRKQLEGWSKVYDWEDRDRLVHDLEKKA